MKCLRYRGCVVVFLFLIFSVIWSAPGHADEAFDELAQQIPGFRLITNAPPVPGKRFFNADNTPVSLRDFEGKALMVNFWATWCTPCVAEMPVLNDLAGEFGGENFEVVAIASGSQVGKDPKAFLIEHELSDLVLYHDPHASLMKLFETETLPTTLLVNRGGQIVGGVVGATEWDSEQARKLIATLIAK